MSPRALLMAVCLAVVMFAGCSPTDTGSSSTPSPPSHTSASATPTPIPSPTQTWSADQAAAIEAVNEYLAADDRIGADPSAFSESQMRALLRESSAGEVLTSTVAGYASMKKQGFRFEGHAQVLSVEAMDASDIGYAIEVMTTACLDQRDLRAVDADGREVPEEQLGYSLPEFNLRQFTVQKREGSKSFLVYGMATVKGECGA